KCCSLMAANGSDCGAVAGAQGSAAGKAGAVVDGASTRATTAGSAGRLSLWRTRYVTLAVTSVSTAAIARYAGSGRLRGAGIATTFAGLRDSFATARSIR